MINLYQCEVCGKTGRNKGEIARHEKIPVTGTEFTINGLYGIVKREEEKIQKGIRVGLGDIALVTEETRADYKHIRTYKVGGYSLERLFPNTDDNRPIQFIGTRLVELPLNERLIRELREDEFREIMESLRECPPFFFPEETIPHLKRGIIDNSSSAGALKKLNLILPDYESVRRLLP